MKSCLSCGTDLGNCHVNRKRCQECAKKVANASTRQSIKKWKKSNPDKVKELNRTWYEKFPLKKRLSHAKDIARSRNKEFLISDEELLDFWNQKCSYCNREILSQTGVGLDRLDNSRGYTKDNVVPCCGDCNKIRGEALTHDEMKVAMKAIMELRMTKSIEEMFMDDWMRHGDNWMPNDEDYNKYSVYVHNMIMKNEEDYPENSEMRVLIKRAKMFIEALNKQQTFTQGTIPE